MNLGRDEVTIGKRAIRKLERAFLLNNELVRSKCDISYNRLDDYI